MIVSGSNPIKARHSSKAFKTHLDAVGVVALLDGGHGDADDALGAGELVVDREGVRLVDLVGGRVLLQDLWVVLGGGWRSMVVVVSLFSPP